MLNSGVSAAEREVGDDSKGEMARACATVGESSVRASFGGGSSPLSPAVGDLADISCAEVEILVKRQERDSPFRTASSRALTFKINTNAYYCIEF